MKLIDYCCDVRIINYTFEFNGFSNMFFFRSLFALDYSSYFVLFLGIFIYFLSVIFKFRIYFVENTFDMTLDSALEFADNGKQFSIFKYNQYRAGVFNLNGNCYLIAGICIYVFSVELNFTLL